jgi:hypothetical protein
VLPLDLFSRLPLLQRKIESDKPEGNRNIPGCPAGMLGSVGIHRVLVDKFQILF